MRNLINHITQIPGWKTNRRIVVIESDDWGSIRMSGLDQYQRLIEKGIPLQTDLYNQIDALESNDDLNFLFDVLKSFRDKFGNHPVITANTIVGNPNWEKIMLDNFQNYYFEGISETIKRYPYSSNILNLYKTGINEKVFYPQFHGREHLHIRFWMDSLKSNDEYITAGFEEKVFGIPLKNKNFKRKNFMASFDCETKSDIEVMRNSIKEGLSIFESMFGYKSKTIIAPCYVWPDAMNEITSQFGVQGIQGIKYQFKPILDSNKYKKIFHFTGQKNKFNQLHLVRNVFFEPTHFYKNQQNYIEELMIGVRRAFRYRNPVIIGAHRLNFIGSLNENNRKINLDLFATLLDKLLFEFPDVEFMNSEQLLNVIQNDKM